VIENGLIVLGVLTLVFYIGYKFINYNPAINNAIYELKKNGDGLSLLKLIVDGTVKWRVPLGRGCRSKDGHLYVEDDMYFYLKIDGYQAYNLCQHPMCDMLECAAINKSRLANAVDNYTEYLNAL